MVYKYLYQDRENRNCEGEVTARSRADAYTALRKQGIRPYRVIGDDPWNWRPWAVAAGFVALLIALVAVGMIAIAQARELKELQRNQMLQQEIEALGELPE